MVSNSTKSPSCAISGRIGYILRFFHRLLSFRHPYRLSTLFTVERETSIFSNFKCSYTTSAHRFVSFLTAMIFASISLGVFRGDVWGRELLVGSSPFLCQTSFLLLYHLTIVDWLYPKYRAVSLVLLPLSIIRIANTRTFPIFSFVVYAMVIPYIFRVMPRY